MVKEVILGKGKLAQEAAKQLAVIDTNVKNEALKKMAGALVQKSNEILEANQKDMEQGKKNGLPDALLDRLLLTEDRLEDMAEGLRALISLPDPIGKVDNMWKQPNGLEIAQVKVPLGVIGIIYESRPNVTVDAAGLCLKTGNAVLLRGGSEAFHSNQALAWVIAHAAETAGIPAGAIQLVETTDREAVQVMLTMNQYLDVLIPRGGAGLIQHVLNNATVPVIETGVGNCHTFIDCDANLDMAVDIAVNAKVHRPGVCNAMENLLVHEEVAAQFLPRMQERMNQHGVVLRGCTKTREILADIEDAVEEDWHTEYLDLVLAVKVVGNLDEAIDHIYRYGTKHSEAIVTENYSTARKFTHIVDAAAVYVNASTRFTDGFQFGFGAEIGISTQKLHARGPMGPEQLTTFKYIVQGDGQIRS
ncbi:glutamate-5-semialdehyde dehydrogenase [Metallumcola ferriviriculae]|uniref:Gamma-glutamyl phosphate reductase n=1 Tax=Metallumcola ferriviriculae TaxID=3039180 RepID=A0AAU0UKF0_9FIRM|nr:glutamate-5-semialdehyde dehydrogenase [Desulfitibacteraceae bacterium MK1]